MILKIFSLQFYSNHNRWLSNDHQNYISNNRDLGNWYNCNPALDTQHPQSRYREGSPLNEPFLRCLPLSIFAHLGEKGDIAYISVSFSICKDYKHFGVVVIKTSNDLTSRRGGRIIIRSVPVNNTITLVLEIWFCYSLQ